MSYRRPPGDPEREPLTVLDELKAAMGSQAFSAQYQQTPVPTGGAPSRGPWFRSYARAPERRSGDRIVQSWDTASKANKTNDFSVCTTWLLRDADYYLLDVLRQRLESPDLLRRILAHAEAHGAMAVLIEEAFPQGRYDDQVNSHSQFLAWASAKRRRNETPSCGPVLFVGTGPDWTY